MVMMKMAIMMMSAIIMAIMLIVITMMMGIMVMLTTTIMNMVVIITNTGTWVGGVMVATSTICIHALRRRTPQCGSARGRLSLQTDDWWM